MLEHRSRGFPVVKLCKKWESPTCMGSRAGVDFANWEDAQAARLDSNIAPRSSLHEEGVRMARVAAKIRT